MPNKAQYDWLEQLKGSALASPAAEDGPQSAGDAAPPKVKIGYPRPVPDDRPEMKLGPAEITEQTLGEPVYGPTADTLYAFLNDSGTGPIDAAVFPMGAELNKRGRAVQAQFNGISKRQVAWNNKVGTIKQNQGAGKRDLAELKDISAALGANTRGQPGQYLRETIEGYRNAVKAAEQQLVEIGIAVKACGIAQDEVVLTDLQGQAVTADRAVKEGQDKVQEEQKRVEEEKQKIEKFFEIAAHMMEPMNWTGLLRATAGCVAEQFLEDHLVSTSHLEDLRKDLDGKKAALASVQDLVQLQAATIAAEKMSLAADKADAARQAFTKFGEDVQMKETTVVEALEKSPSTGEVAKIIGRRTAVLKAADAAETLMRDYLKETEPFVATMKGLGDTYRSYRSMAVKDTPGVPYNVPYRAALADLTVRNADTMDQFVQWMEDMRSLARSEIEYLSKGRDDTYFAGYKDVPDALKTALADRNLKK